MLLTFCGKYPHTICIIMVKTILVVDDSSSMRIVVKLALSAAGYAVIEAADGLAALKILEQQSVNMVISDVNMPLLNGFEFCERARAMPLHKFTPILMLTTEYTDDKKQAGRKVGATGWLTKPFLPTQLVKAVEKLAK